MTGLFYFMAGALSTAIPCIILLGKIIEDANKSYRDANELHDRVEKLFSEEASK